MFEYPAPSSLLLLVLAPNLSLVSSWKNRTESIDFLGIQHWTPSTDTGSEWNGASVVIVNCNPWNIWLQFNCSLQWTTFHAETWWILCRYYYYLTGIHKSLFPPLILFASPRSVLRASGEHELQRQRSGRRIGIEMETVQISHAIHSPTLMCIEFCYSSNGDQIIRSNGSRSPFSSSKGSFEVLQLRVFIGVEAWASKLERNNSSASYFYN